MTDLSLANDFAPATEAQWRAAVDKALKGADFDKKLTAKTADGLTIQPLYMRAAGLENQPWRAHHGRWHLTQRLDLPSPTDASAQALADLEGGADALTISFAGARAARGFGLRAETLAELDAALAGVMLDLIHLRIDPAPSGRMNAALVAALVKKRAHAPAALSIDFGLDPIGIFASTGSMNADWPTIARRQAMAVTDLTAMGFKGPFMSADGRPYHEAGASQAQELAAILSTALAYLRALEANGIGLENAAQAISMLAVAEADQFMTIAKFRALRRLWARVLAACGLPATPLRLHAETSWRMMTKCDTHVNMLRTTIAVFAAGIGGADGISVLPFSQPLGLPDAFARRVARNSQLVLMEEASLWRVADPSAGSGGIETLTQTLCQKAWELFQDIEREGGMIQSLTSGAMQQRIARTRAERDKAVASRREPLTGTSEFPNLGEKPVAVLESRPTPVPTTASGEAAAFGHKLSFAEMIAVLSEGKPRSAFAPKPRDGLTCPALAAYRLAEPFEALRDASDAHLATTGARPKAFLANLGRIADFTARATFMRNLFEAGGIEAGVNDGFACGDGSSDIAALVAAFKASGAKLACLCSSDTVYAQEAIAVATALKAAGATLWLAGRPGDLEAALTGAGITSYAYAGADILSLLKTAHAITGVSA